MACLRCVEWDGSVSLIDDGIVEAQLRDIETRIVEIHKPNSCLIENNRVWMATEDGWSYYNKSGKLVSQTEEQMRDLETSLKERRP